MKGQHAHMPQEEEETKERRRRPGNDHSIILTSINGRTDDPKIGKPQDRLATTNK